MKKVFLTISVIALFTVSCKEDKSNKTATTDAKKVEETTKNSTKVVKVEKGTLSWIGYKPAESHNGTIDFKSGAFKMEADKLVGGDFTFNMAAIKVLDIEDAKYNGKLVGHLSAADFFDVANFPTAKFEITSVKPEGDKLMVEGNITIKGITKNLKFPATFTNKDGVLSFKGETVKIDRTEFGIKYNSGKFFENLKDKLIKDIFDISVEFTTKK